MTHSRPLPSLSSPGLTRRSKPRLRPLKRWVDCRVKPGNDNDEQAERLMDRRVKPGDDKRKKGGAS
jgi:hypothetical protein